MLHKVHKFEPQSLDIALPRKSVALKKSVFQPVDPPTLPLRFVQSGQAKPDFFSPSASNVGQPTADLMLLRYARRHGWAVLEKAWMGFFCEAKHNVVFRFVQDGQGSGENWFMAIAHYDDSSCIVWDVKLATHPGALEEVLIVPARRPTTLVMPIVSLHNVEAFEVRWRSWARQRRDMKSAFVGARPAFRLFRSTLVMPILKICAMRG